MLGRQPKRLDDYQRLIDGAGVLKWQNNIVHLQTPESTVREYQAVSAPPVDERIPTYHTTPLRATFADPILLADGVGAVSSAAGTDAPDYLAARVPYASPEQHGVFHGVFRSSSRLQSDGCDPRSPSRMTVPASHRRGASPPRALFLKQSESVPVGAPESDPLLPPPVMDEAVPPPLVVEWRSESSTGAPLLGLVSEPLEEERNALEDEAAAAKAEGVELRVALMEAERHAVNAEAAAEAYRRELEVQVQEAEEARREAEAAKLGYLQEMEAKAEALTGQHSLLAELHAEREQARRHQGELEAEREEARRQQQQAEVAAAKAEALAGQCTTLTGLNAEREQLRQLELQAKQEEMHRQQCVLRELSAKAEALAGQCTTLTGLNAEREQLRQLELQAKQEEMHRQQCVLRELSAEREQMRLRYEAIAAQMNEARRVTPDAQSPAELRDMYTRKWYAQLRGGLRGEQLRRISPPRCAAPRGTSRADPASVGTLITHKHHHLHSPTGEAAGQLSTAHCLPDSDIGKERSVGRHNTLADVSTDIPCYHSVGVPNVTLFPATREYSTRLGPAKAFDDGPCFPSVSRERKGVPLPDPQASLPERGASKGGHRAASTVSRQAATSVSSSSPMRGLERLSSANDVLAYVHSVVSGESMSPSQVPTELQLHA